MDALSARVVEWWAAPYRLTRSETAVLALGLNGYCRATMADLRGVRPGTIQRQVKLLLAKTGDRSLPLAALRCVRESCLTYFPASLPDRRQLPLFEDKTPRPAVEVGGNSAGRGVLAVSGDG